MSSTQSPNLAKYHLIGFAIVLFSLFGLVFYQIFHRRIPLRKFLSFSLLKQAFNKLPYQPLDPGQPQNFPDPNPLSVICQPSCIFAYQEKTIPAIVDLYRNDRLTDLDSRFFDPQAGLIGYQNKKLEDPTFYVIDFELQLLQVIKLNLNHQRQLSFINYYPNTKQILFKSTDLNNGNTEFMLYSATSPSLTLLGEDRP